MLGRNGMLGRSGMLERSGMLGYTMLEMLQEDLVSGQECCWPQKGEGQNLSVEFSSFALQQ